MLSLLTVGNLVCLVLLCLISARRDKVCPQYRERNWGNTNPPGSLVNPFGHVGNSYTCSPHFFWSQMVRFWPSYSAFTDWHTFVLTCLQSLCYITYGTNFSYANRSGKIWKNLNKCWKNRSVECLGQCLGLCLRCLGLWYQLFLCKQVWKNLEKSKQMSEK